MAGIHKRFGATAALSGVDLRVGAGEVLALVGENGAGKSTLMKVLSGAHRPDAGQMWLDSRPYAPAGPLAARRAGVCMIYQELSLAPHLSVAENILLGLEPTVGPILRRAEMRRIAAAALAQLGHDDLAPDATVSTLSIAEQQLVEIARALAVGCRVLVLDEPTSSLTARDIGRLFDLIRRLRTGGHAIVYISHFLEEVKAVSDRFTVLRDGQSVGEGATVGTTPARIISMMVGRDVNQLYPRSRRTRGEPLLSVDGLTGEGVTGASLTLHRGEVLGIAGLIGAGRTQLLRMLQGLDQVRAGAIRFGHFSGWAGPSRRWRQGMGLVSEDRKREGLALNLSIADNLNLSSMPCVLSPAGLAARAHPWLQKLMVRCRSPRQAVGDLSGGNQQKVALARLLHHNVDVLLLDEPTRGIDVPSKATIYHAIDQLALEGKAILLVSSYLPELLGVCDRIAVMRRGELQPARDVAELSEQSVMQEAIGAVMS